MRLSGSQVQPGAASTAAVIDRQDGAHGELALRRRGAHYEIISNGMFLMDTTNGRSERLLVRAALAGLPGPARLLLGGLGVGFSVAEAVTLPSVAEVTVVEVEPAVIGWHAVHLAPFSAGALANERVHVVCADLVPWLSAGEDQYDAVCLDIDNGPEWTLAARNAELYSDAGLALLARRVRPNGTIAVWSAGPAPEFEERLRRRFGPAEVIAVPVPRGAPDLLYLARRPAA